MKTSRIIFIIAIIIAAFAFAVLQGAADAPVLNVPEVFYFKLEAALPDEAREYEEVTLDICIWRTYGSFPTDGIKQLAGVLFLDDEIFEIADTFNCPDNWTVDAIYTSKYIVFIFTSSHADADYMDLHFTINLRIKPQGDTLINGERRYAYAEDVYVVDEEGNTFAGIGGIAYTDIFAGAPPVSEESSQENSEESSSQEEVVVTLDDLLEDSGIYLINEYLYTDSDNKSALTFHNKIKQFGAGVYDENGVLRLSGYISTGYTLEFDSNGEHYSYKFVVLGDVNGDGYLSTYDYFALRMHLLGNVEFTDTQIAAADINMSGTISSIDYFALRMHLLKTYNLYSVITSP